MSSNKSKKLEDQYKHLSPREHVLHRPDIYIGSKENIETLLWIYDEENKKIVPKKMLYVPILFKMFDEIITNAADHSKRDKKLTEIKITIDKEKGSIKVWNNGKGIKTDIHKDANMPLPQLIFGCMNTSENYDDNQKKVTGGLNGVGAKLANIFSKKFIVETVCDNKYYKQTFEENMSVVKKPKIKDTDKNGFTSITFYPDFEKFSKENFISDDMISLIYRRTLDIASSTGLHVNVYWNKKKCFVYNLESYMNLYIGNKKENKRVYYSDDKSKRWQIGVTKLPDNLKLLIRSESDTEHFIGYGNLFQISFVNGIFTGEGGTHVNHITTPVINQIKDAIKKKNKSLNVTKQHILKHLLFFINCVIENPKFRTQTKDYHSTLISKFGSKCDIPEKTLQSIGKLDIIADIIQEAQIDSKKQLIVPPKSIKNNIMGIPKLDDANFAGSNKSNECTLIITEGDSAKTFAVSGLSVIGRDYYGAFPIRGKFLNVKKANREKILNNVEVCNLLKILGLKEGMKNIDDLRYGKILLLADADEDGTHIIGLLINLIHTFWPEFMTKEGFICTMKTPVVKLFNKNKSIPFYNLSQLEEYKKNNDLNGFKEKYYKGLGTSTAAEAKEYFKNFDELKVDYVSQMDNEDEDGDEDGDGDEDEDGDGDEDEEKDEVKDKDEVKEVNKNDEILQKHYHNVNDTLNLAFGEQKKDTEHRKLWVNRAMEDLPYRDYSEKKVSYDNFVKKDLVRFSIEDNKRSIPGPDGLKPSQRKVLYGCFKRNLKNQIKVAQLGGYISEHTAYHHGETSLFSTIINMAQDYPGSNNLSLLLPIGQFGSRLLNGKDSASPRYIFTKLNKKSDLIFNPVDNALLNYCYDGNEKIEPKFYVPIVPIVLINGTDGIGTGYSSTIPCYNPSEIIDLLKTLFKNPNETLEEPIPWYKDFSGTIRKVKDFTFECIGCFNKLSKNSLEVTEIPIGLSINDYKEFLEKIILEKKVKRDKEKPIDKYGIVSFQNHSSENKPHFIIKFQNNKLQEMMTDIDSFMTKMKLIKFIKTSNMHMFDKHGFIKKYHSPIEILRDFYYLRKKMYGLRKEYLLHVYSKEIEMLKSIVKFMKYVMEDTIVVYKKKEKHVIKKLEEHEFPKFIATSLSMLKKYDLDSKYLEDNEKNRLNVSQLENDSDEESDEESDDKIKSTDSNQSYNYLLNISIKHFTKEKIDALKEKLDNKNEEHKILNDKTDIDLWNEDLDKLNI